MATIDHLILPVNDVAESLAFYVDVLGFTADGSRPPFTVVRVSDDFVLQLAPWGTDGNVHLAFALARRISTPPSRASRPARYRTARPFIRSAPTPDPASRTARTDPGRPSTAPTRTAT